MNNVYRYTIDDWAALKMLKGTVELMKERNSDGRFDIAIRKETNLYREFIAEGHK